MFYTRRGSRRAAAAEIKVAARGAVWARDGRCAAREADCRCTQRRMHKCFFACGEAGGGSLVSKAGAAALASAGASGAAANATCCVTTSWPVPSTMTLRASRLEVRVRRAVLAQTLTQQRAARAGRGPAAHLPGQASSPSLRPVGPRGARAPKNTPPSPEPTPRRVACV